jgi:deaminated glutathione amidase
MRGVSSPASELLRVAAVQLSCQENVEENLRAAAAQVRAAAERGARLIVLPENFAYLGPEPGKRRHAERLGDLDAPIQRAVTELARETAATVVAGGFPERSPDPDRPFNTCAVFAPDGRILGAYRKIHLFDVELPDGTALRESVATSAGGEPVVVKVDRHKIGLSVCYDLRFPELYRALVDRGAEVLLVPAAFTLQTGKDHWHVLLRARAIESQCWVIAAAQWGRHAEGRASYGHALIADPWGTVVADCSDGVGIAVADVDRSITERIRRSLPCLAHRKL